MAFTRGMVEEAFGGLDPETAQYDMDVETLRRVLAELKPAFIHHPESKEHLRAILVEHGLRPGADVLRRAAPADLDVRRLPDHGIAYAFHPHRDTWYSAPMMQLNWWLPIYDVVPDNVVAFHPAYFDQPVKNGSERYNYYEWNRDSRGAGGLADRRRHPRAAQAGGADRRSTRRSGRSRRSAG